MTSWYEALIDSKIVGHDSGNNYLTLDFDNGKKLKIYAHALIMVADDGTLKSEPYITCEIRE